RCGPGSARADRAESPAPWARPRPADSRNRLGIGSMAHEPARARSNRTPRGAPAAPSPAARGRHHLMADVTHWVFAYGSNLHRLDLERGLRSSNLPPGRIVQAKQAHVRPGPQYRSVLGSLAVATGFADTLGRRLHP